jgi:hypothetical protein
MASPSLHAVIAPDRPVALCVPADLPYQLIFRMRRTQPYEVPARADATFHFARNLGQFLKLSGSVQHTIGAVELVRSMIRMIVGRRFYCVLRDGQLLHRGWANVAFCRHYKVGPGEVVIGPIWSSPAARGTGLATWATQSAINELLRENLSVFYIDTSHDNAACLAMIAKCGFGTAVGCTPREAD